MLHCGGVHFSIADGDVVVSAWPHSCIWEGASNSLAPALLMEPGHGSFAESEQQRQSATDEFCEYHGQQGDETKTSWKKQIKGKYGAQYS